MSKILAIGDPHFKINNLADIDTYIQNVCDIIKREGIDLVIILGDLLHTHEKVHSLVLNKAYDFIRCTRDLARTVVLVGNHDYINNSQFLSENHWMNAMKEWSNVDIVDKGLVIDAAVGKIVLCPYVAPGRFEEALDIIDPDWKNAAYIFAHQEMYGCKMGAIISADGDKWETDYPMLVCGHIHNKQTLQPNLFYTGSSIQHAFGESHDKTVSIFGNLDQERIDLSLNMKGKRIIATHLDSIDCLKLPQTNDDLRLNIAGTADDFKTFKKTSTYKDLKDSNIKIVFKPDKVETNTIQVTWNSFYDAIQSKANENPEVKLVYDQHIK